MVHVQHILNVKGSRIVSIGPEMLIRDALNLMAKENIGAVPVMDGGSIAGFFSERDYARRAAALDRTDNMVPVRDFMSTAVVSVSPQHSLQECMKLMTERRVRHLPVVDGTAVIGLISIGDVVKEIMTEQEHMINQLENYITGKR